MELPQPDVLGCFFDKNFDPHLPAMELRWSADAPGVAERAWHLPESVCLKGPAPARFGIRISRLGENTYRVRVLWNRLCLVWDDLGRVQIMASSLAVILQAMGTDLWYLLNQPIEEERSASAQAA